MSRCVTRRNQRLARARNHRTWLADCERYEAREVERAAIAGRLRELSAKVRDGLDYPGRRDDLAEIDRIWAALAGAAR